jgi:hypothetical protein
VRQLSPPTNLLLACLAALGLLGTLNLPWYAPPVPDTTETDGPVERAAWAVSRVFAHHDHQVSGNDVIGGGRTLLYVLAAAVCVLAIVAAVSALRPLIRDALRIFAIIAPVVVLYLAIDRPGDNAELTIHWGTLVALAVALFMASAAWQGSAIRERRPAPGAWARQTS